MTNVDKILLQIYVYDVKTIIQNGVSKVDRLKTSLCS